MRASISRTWRRRTACIAHCCCRAILTPRPRRYARAVAALRRRDRRHHQRQLRSRLAPRHRRRRHRLRPGCRALIDLRGQPDLFGRMLEVSIIGFADEIAAAASLLQGQAAEGTACGTGAWSELVCTSALAPPIWCARSRRICSGDRGRTVRWRRWRQAGTRPSAACCRPRNCSSSATPATISSISACGFRLISTR